MKISRKVTVRNSQGLHTRPASLIVRILQESKSSVHFVYRKEKVNARSIMSLLTLAACKNSQIIMEAEGEDAENTLERLAEAFEQKFWEKTHESS